MPNTTNMDQITINSENIAGTLKVAPSRFLNISSIPRQFFTNMMARLPNAPSQFAIAPLHTGLIYSVELKKFMKGVKTSRSVTLVYDEDTKYINTIVQNINRYTPNKVINKIMVKKEESKIGTHGRTGVTIFMCNPQHTLDTIKKLGCINVLQDKSSAYASATIIKTNDALCGSIAGLTVILNWLKIPFTIEIRQLTINKSWLFLIKDEFNTKYHIDNSDIVDFNSLKNTNVLQYNIGYTVYLPTEKGYKTISDKANSGSKKSIWATILETFKRIVLIVISWMYKPKMKRPTVGSLLRKKSKRKTKK